MQASSKSQSINYTILGRLLSRLKEHKKSIVLGIMLLGFTTALSLLPSWLIKYTIDSIVGTSQTDRLLRVALLLIGATLVKGVLYYFQRITMEGVGQQIVHDLRSQAISHVNSLSFSFFDQTEIGDLVSRITSDTSGLTRFFGMGLVNIVNNVFLLVGILAVLICWNPALSLPFIALIPFIIHAMSKYAKRVSPLEGRIRRQFGTLTTQVQQTLAGTETIKLMGLEEYEHDKFEQKAHKLLQHNVAVSKISAFWMPYSVFLTALGTAMTLLWGGYLVINETITYGMLFGFMSYLSMLVRPIRSTGMLLSLTVRTTAIAERIFSILDMRHEEIDDGVWPGDLRRNIEFENVSFAYREGVQVLEDVTLRVDKGKTVALVGHSGAGKSTLVNLIPGFYRAQQGRVMIDSIDIRDINLKKLRENIGYLRQHPFLFDGTIAENISFGKPEATMSEIITAAKRVMLHDFVGSLPQGYKTTIGEKGVRLSGGQQQRLAMARVLITDPSILILDEPTSNLDHETEEKINAALREILSGRTVFVIAHRLWTIKDADMVVFLCDGKIEALGTHDELYSTNEKYRQLVDSQLHTDEEVSQ